MHEAPIRCSDPKIPIAITEQPRSRELLHSSWERICLDLPPDKAFDTCARAEQERAVIAVSETLYCVPRSLRGIEFSRAGFPVPHPIPQSHPEVAVVVLVQTEANSITKGSILSVAVDSTFLNRTQLCRRWEGQPAGPYRALAIFEDGSANRLSVKLRVLTQ